MWTVLRAMQRAHGGRKVVLYCDSPLYPMQAFIEQLHDMAFLHMVAEVYTNLQQQDEMQSGC